MRLPSPPTFRAAGLSLIACLSANSQGLFGSQSSTNSPALEFRVPGAPLIVVADAPFSGRTTITNVRTRPDGVPITSSITRETKWRDSKGRVRTEPNRQQPPALVYIDDPVSGYSIVLNPADHIAHRAVARALPYTGTDPFAGMLQVNPSCNPPIVDRLGTKDFSGIKATGLRTTTNCPAGTYRGNDKPVAMTDETWKSADYNLTLLRKQSSPDNGESTVAIEEFKPAEPDPSLFRIPPEYRVVDETAPFTISIPSNSGGGRGAGPGPISVRIDGPSGGGSFGVSGDLPVVKQAPYSGREVTTQDQTLADGTRLRQAGGMNTDGNKMWRDSAGRVRTEYASRGGSWTIAEIADPAGYGYVLDPWNRIAHQFPLRVNETTDRALLQRFGMQGGRGGSSAVTGTIGAMEMSGVPVTGYRVVTTGRTSEVWEYSPYGLALQTKDTRTTPAGIVLTLTTTIEDFNPKEPDPALFTIPEGYRIVDEVGTITIKIPEPAK